jgi:hypothetical protein
VVEGEARRLGPVLRLLVCQAGGNTRQIRNAVGRKAYMVVVSGYRLRAGLRQTERRR